jgi:hypothetical protein
MTSLPRLLGLALTFGLLFGEGAIVAQAQQFYNPWRYHHTRQQMSNRAVAKSTARRAARKRRQARRSSTRKPAVRAAKARSR